MKKCVFYFLVSLGLTLVSALAQATSLSIQLQDYRHPGAAVYIAIYAAKEGASWNDKPLKLLQSLLNESNEMHIESGLPEGRYALRAFVDINGNGVLDTGALGKPLEPFAFSRATGAANSLRFKAAIVNVDTGESLVLRFLHPKAGAKTIAKDADSTAAVPTPIAP